MAGDGSPEGLIDEAVSLAQASLQEGERLAPLMVIEHRGDRRVERFDRDAITEAKGRLGEFLRTPGEEECVLVYQGRVGHAEDAILVEGGSAGKLRVEIYAQRFRPHRGRFRGFKLIGDLTRVGVTESTPI
jgi:hypothetical protein